MLNKHLHSITMKRNRTIHNLNSLEQEINRLQGEARDMEKKMSDNMEWFSKNAIGILFDGLMCRKMNSAKQDQQAVRDFKNRAMNRFVMNLADRIATRAVNSFDGLLNKLSRNKPSS